MAEKHKDIHIKVNRKQIELDRDQMTGAELLGLAGFEGDEWDLLELDGEGDPSGGRLVEGGEELKLKNGQHFRVIPGNRTFGHPIDELR